jgi:hypothetical protein
MIQPTTYIQRRRCVCKFRSRRITVYIQHIHTTYTTLLTTTGIRANKTTQFSLLPPLASLNFPKVSHLNVSETFLWPFNPRELLKFANQPKPMSPKQTNFEVELSRKFPSCFFSFFRSTYHAIYRYIRRDTISRPSNNTCLSLVPSEF